MQPTFRQLSTCACECARWVFRSVILISGLFAGLLGTNGCADLKQAKQTINKTRAETTERLEALQVRGEMDFDLQAAFKTYELTYQYLWNQQPITGWGDLIQAEGEVETGGFSVNDAKKQGIVGVFQLPATSDPKRRAEFVIGYAPTGRSGQFWVLRGDSKFQKMNQAELDAALATQNAASQ